MNKTLWIHHARPRPTWYELEPAEKSNLRDRWSRLDAQATQDGAQQLGTFSVRGQSDYSVVSIWQFVSPEAVHQFWSERVAAEYATWFAFSNEIAVSAPSEDAGL
jgi:hypothetical protein